MINYEAFLKVSYGLFLVSSGNKQQGNGYISNTFFQVTAEPPKFATCCNKDNYTANLIKEAGSFAVSVLHTEAPKDIFSKFGYQSGKDNNKMEGMYIQYGETGVPIIINESVAFFECKVVETVDVGTHLMFIGELVQAELLDKNLDPITYQYYREVKKGFAPKNAPTYLDKSKLDNSYESNQEKQEAPKESKKYKCNVCGFEYDENEEGTPFEDLPNDWKCPVCGADKDDFSEI